MKLGDALFLKAVKERERYARRVLDINSVQKRMAEVSEQGFGELQLRQSRPISLETTEAAQHLTAWLDINAIRYQWQPVTRKERGLSVEFRELHLEWAPCMVTVVEEAARNLGQIKPMLNDLAIKRKRALARVNLADTEHFL